ncbi:RIP metalloprotease RseP [Panacagrimonas sp.]|uniref:RIP metalloprotease RseP n=1 Tax=Panacagrimonas sp. TaxID=2480088 RepID=UPI003B51F7E0
MLDLIWSIAGFIVALSILVCFHEFGHYWVARKLGIKVLRFSLGWGKPWKSFRTRDGVEWALAPYPIGGYVKMLDEREGPVEPAERHLAFNRQSVPTRMAVLVAGPAANFLLAIALYWLMFMIGVQGLRPLIDTPLEGTAAAQAGLRSGDEVLAVDGKPVPTWNELRMELIDGSLGGASLPLTIRDADGGERQVALSLQNVRSDPQFLFGDLGLEVWQPRIEPVLGQILPGSAAEAAGLRTQDRVLAIEGQPIEDWSALVAAVRERPASVTRIEIERAGQRSEIQVVVGAAEEAGRQVGRLGAGPVVDEELWQNLRAARQLGPMDAVPAAMEQAWQVTQLTLRVLWHMVLGEVSVKNVSGPIQIAQVAGDSAQIGLVSFLSFMAVVSVSLGVLNLLPVPLLDGGHLVMYAIEGVKGRPLSERTQVAAQYVGLAFIGMLMVLALFNDIMRLV